LVIGPDGYRELPSLIESARGGVKATAVDFDLEEHYEDFTPRRFDGVKAWIPVQRGCDYKCTYCIVPTTRGPERSRQLSEVVRETEAVIASGISEVVLLGQTVNSYYDGKHDFADLLRAVGSVPGIRRLRFTSPHPNDFSERVIRAMAEIEAFCEHVHLPMQSGSTRTLRRMLRRYTRDVNNRCDCWLSGRDRRRFSGNAHSHRGRRLRRRVHVQILAERWDAGHPLPRIGHHLRRCCQRKTGATHRYRPRGQPGAQHGTHRRAPRSSGRKIRATRWAAAVADS
ncbi:MAG: hypothetical protein DMD72_08495, partial [Gemmatimonadetes bacterium]